MKKKANNKPITFVDLDGMEEWSLSGNTITFHARFAAFSNRPEGGNVPNNLDIVEKSAKHWQQLNDELLKEIFFLNVFFDSKGAPSVGSAFRSSSGQPYRFQFDVQVKVFDSEYDADFEEFSKSEEFAGVYLFGNNIDFDDKILKNDVINSPARVFWDIELFGKKNTKEVVLFRNETAFTYNNETHEAGHTFGLGHFGIDDRYIQKLPNFKYADKRDFYTLTTESGDVYNSSGLMKYSNARGSSIPKYTQVINLLNSNNYNENNN